MKISLKNICSFQSGGTPSKQNSDYFNGNIPWITTVALNGRIIDQNSAVDWITEKAIQESAAKIVPAGSIMVGTRVGVGKVAINAVPMSTSQDIISLVGIDGSKWNKEYLCKFLQSKESFLKSQSRGATIKGIKIDALAALEVPGLPLSEQEKIVSVLNHTLDIIEQRKAQLAALDELVKARFVEMFGNPFDTMNPAKWPQKTIRELAENISDGSNVDQSLYKKYGDVLFLRIQNVWCNEFRLEDSVYISKDENERYRDTSLKHGDLLITKIGRYYTVDSSLGRVSVYLDVDDKANYSNNIMRVRFKSEVNSEFVNALMNLDDYNQFIRRTSVGGTDKRALSKSLIAGYPVVVPPIDKQNEYVSFIHQIYKSKSVIQKSLEKTQLLFDSLMQEYFG